MINPAPGYGADINQFVWNMQNMGNPVLSVRDSGCGLGALQERMLPLVLPGPVTRQGSDLRMQVVIRNPEPETMPIERLTIGLLPCQPVAPLSMVIRGPGAIYRELSAGSVLRTDSIPAGEIEAEVRVPAGLISHDVCQVYLWGAGQSRGGLRLDLQISMMVMSPKAVPFDLHDPQQVKYLEKVRRAASLLGRTSGRISGEEISRLEQEGKLQGSVR